MKKKLLFTLAIVLGAVFYYFNKESKIEKLQAKHTEFLKNHPFKEIENLSKKERLAQGLPPSKYLERMWVLTANPELGRPTPEKLADLHEELKNKNLERVPGDGTDNAWIERGPNNIGGRTRTVFFDPNDATQETAYAGGVSGGLWKNTNISNAASVWTKVEDLDNYSISCYAIDPNNSNIWYVGTGESYTGSDAIGNGIYKTTNGGANWTRVLSASGATQTGTQYRVPGIYYINDIIVRDSDGNAATTNDSEVFAGIAAAYYGDGGGSPATFLGVSEYGVYRSSDNGTNWAQIPINNSDGRPIEPNDFEIGADNTLWMSTINNIYGDAGGEIYSSSNGNTFTLQHTITDGNRTELATSKTNAGTIYALAQINGAGPSIIKTTDAFATTPSDLTLPDDPDNSVTADDFTRGQSFYDLVIEVDPTNDNIIYLGGINAHRAGVTDPSGSPLWKTISYWAAGRSPSLPGSLIHADHHALEFKHTNSNNGLFGTDGGVYYSSNLSDVAEGSNAASAVARNNGFNVTQFYTVGVAPTAAFPGEGDYILAGAQDNGTQLMANGVAGVNSSIDVSGGDGAYSFFDQDGTDKYYITNYVYNQSIRLFNYATNSSKTINSETTSNGDFINVEALDSQLNILYSNYSSGTNFIIRKYADLLGSVTTTDLTTSLLDASPTAITVSALSSSVLVGTETGKVLKYSGTPPFQTWSDISDANFIGSVSDIEYGTTDNDIFLTFHNYGVVNVWYSADGGTTWSAKEGDLPDLPVKAILQNPLNDKEVIIGTDLGVWKTSDFSVAAPVWTQSYNGMNSVKVTDLDLRDDNKVFASTYGRGVFSGEFTAATASVNDVFVDNKTFAIYPTVSNGNFTLQAKNTLGNTKMTVFNINGKQVHSQNVDFSSNVKQDVSVNLNAGVYIVNIVDENNKKSSSKIIIE